MKKFNTTGVCIPEKHYMVDLTDRLCQIKAMVDEGEYFCISRARQYGKTTTLYALGKYLQDEYEVLSLDLQDLGGSTFGSEESFVRGMARIICDGIEFMDISMSDEYARKFETLSHERDEDAKLNDLMRLFLRWFREHPKRVVLLIDEVDSAANSQVFLDFLSSLRSMYLKRAQNSKLKTFQSVILAGVADVRHLRSRIREESRHKVNSPWNIAADFDIDMSLGEEGIRGMLDEYEADHQTGMDTAQNAKLIHDYTNGYPFLVSRICQLIDQEVSRSFGSLSKAWTRSGMDEAVKQLMSEKNALFDSLTGKINNYPELRQSLRSVLMEGEKLTYNIFQESISQMEMYGFIRNVNNRVMISNRIFETLLYNLFLSDEELKNNRFSQEGVFARNLFVKDGKLDMQLIMRRFIDTYTQVYGPLEERFKEKDGRELFLLYLRPIINGTGNYYIEAQTRDQKRTDVIVDYMGVQYIIELKIWHGERYHADGEQQIRDYLDYWQLDTGYMLSFNFNQNKKQGVERVQVGDKVIFEGTV